MAMPVLRAALGFRLHTGWAAVVAVARQPGKIEVLLRRRLELLPVDGSIPRFVYHTAAELDADEAAALVKRATTGAIKTSQTAVKEILQMLRGLDVSLQAAGIPTGSTKLPAELARILASHPLIHSAEGALFQQAVAGACEHCGLAIVTVREREALARAAEAIRSNASRFRESLDGLRKTVGPPWGADQKTATAAALVALTSVRESGSRESSKG